jgi:hypothetical protein
MLACARRVRARATKDLRPEELRRLKELLLTVQGNLHTAHLVGETA